MPIKYAFDGLFFTSRHIFLFLFFVKFSFSIFVIGNKSEKIEKVEWPLILMIGIKI
jgi:hypothetical protein